MIRIFLIQDTGYRIQDTGYRIQDVRGPDWFKFVPNGFITLIWTIIAQVTLNRRALVSQFRNKREFEIKETYAKSVILSLTQNPQPSFRKEILSQAQDDGKMIENSDKNPYVERTLNK